jgi:hypothetical protein
MTREVAEEIADDLKNQALRHDVIQAYVDHQSWMNTKGKYEYGVVVTITIPYKRIQEKVS